MIPWSFCAGCKVYQRRVPPSFSDSERESCNILYSKQHATHVVVVVVMKHVRYAIPDGELGPVLFKFVIPNLGWTDWGILSIQVVDQDRPTEIKVINDWREIERLTFISWARSWNKSRRSPFSQSKPTRKWRRREIPALDALNFTNEPEGLVGGTQVSHVISVLEMIRNCNVQTKVWTRQRELLKKKLVI